MSSVGVYPPERIRNFSIIAHIDHGKSTLADRLIERCGALSQREMMDQVLDSMDLERERGITIKSQSVALNYTAEDQQTYLFNLIDTPGHVDFAYEVSRSLVACEGALLVVDAGKGVQAQSLATSYMALENDVEVLPVLNKIDLPSAEPERVTKEIDEIIGLDTNDMLRISAKSGLGIDELLEAIVHYVPPPAVPDEQRLQALIVDSWFDNYLGIVSLVRVMSGTIRAGDRIVSHAVGKVHVVDEVGVFTPHKHPLAQLTTGEVGYVVAGIKELSGAPVGDTIKHANSDVAVLPGFQQIKPQVYAGLFPTVSDDFQALRVALEKLSLNDASLQFEAENSDALGYGFRCGFLGMLHMEIIQERLEREYDLDLITSAPSVVYEVFHKDGTTRLVDNPSQLGDPANIAELREPIADVNIIVPTSYVGAVMDLCSGRRGQQLDSRFTGNQVSLQYLLPLSEVILDFFDRLKSVSRGYASLDYSFREFRTADLVRIDILINGDPIDSLATIVHRESARAAGQQLTVAMKKVIPRQMYDVAIQAAIGRQVIARTTVKAFRKNVTAKCYGGDVTRKKKLLEKQKAGKKRMKRVGSVELPQEAFLAALKIDKK